MKSARWTAAVLVAAATAYLAAQSQQPKQYTMDWVMSGAPMPMTMHISKDEDKQRVDMEMPTMAPGTMQLFTCTTTTIVRPDLKKIYVLTHFKKQYQEKEFNPRFDVSDPRSEAGKVEELGSETIDGDECTKYRLSMDQGTMLMWTSKKTNLMRRIAREGNAGFAVDVKNIQIGPPPANLFEVPADYKQAAGPAEKAKGVFATLGAGLASSFMPNMVAGAAAAAQARAEQAQAKADVETMAKVCKPAQMPGRR